MSEKLSSVRVPDELYRLITDEMHDVFEEWKTKPLREVLAEVPRPRVFEINGRQSRATVLPAITAEKSATTLVITAEHQQDLTDMHKAQYLLLQQAIAPMHDVVIFANNGTRSDNYTFTPEERKRLSSGDFTPYAEMQSRMLSALHLGPIAMTGY